VAEQTLGRVGSRAGAEQEAALIRAGRCGFLNTEVVFLIRGS
jgi:hypothetical protein